MEFLPIDYYILLQEGFQKSPKPKPSNHVFFMNLPLLVKKRSYLKQSTEIIKNVTFEDVMRCLDKNESEQLLNNQFAEEELTRHLTDKFGPIKDFFHINYDPTFIMNQVRKTGRGVSNDEILEFEQSLLSSMGDEQDHSLIEEASF